MLPITGENKEQILYHHLYSLVLCDNREIYRGSQNRLIKWNHIPFSKTKETQD